ncbi:MAG: NAD(+) synthase [Planctomycetia bacterium]|nr:NAD(+) synthase [Planctomycetia bacterium]
MLRDWEKERDARVIWIRSVLNGMGVVYGNSGGKDCTLAGILCRMATDRVLGVILPCQSSRNFGQDRDDALRVAKQFDIPTIEVDVTPVKEAFLRVLEPVLQGMEISEENAAKGKMNINPRLRMTTLYTIAQSRGALVCGTGNRSEATMGYFTKWGDGACDFNPIADLTATEIFDFLRFLGAPSEIIEKAPSAGLFEGQTDEAEMGIRYAEIDEYLLHGTGTEENIARIEHVRDATSHKRTLPKTYPG